MARPLTLENCPPLPGDDARSRPLPARCYQERRVIWNLIRVLAAEGFAPSTVDNGGDDPAEITPGPSAALDTMAEAFACDDARIYFRRRMDDGGWGRACWVYIVLGNSAEEVISDYSCHDAEPGWQRIMDAFDCEDYC